MGMIGAGSGAVATIAMSALMLGAQKAGLTGKLPPQKITQRALDALHLRRGRKTDDLSTLVGHLGYGSAVGGLYGGWLRGKILPRSPVTEGVLFGGVVWLASYFGWVPALRILPRPTKDRPGRAITMFVAHVLFGAVLGALAPRVPNSERD